MEHHLCFPPEATQVLSARTGDLIAVEQNNAGCGRNDLERQVGDSGFAGSRFPYQPQGASGNDAK